MQEKFIFEYENLIWKRDIEEKYVVLPFGRNFALKAYQRNQQLSSTLRH